MSVVEKVRYSDEDLAMFKALIEEKIKEAENFSDANKNKLSDFFNALRLYSFDKNEKENFL